MTVSCATGKQEASPSTGHDASMEVSGMNGADLASQASYENHESQEDEGEVGVGDTDDCTKYTDFVYRPPHEDIKYQSRKPRWWRTLSGKPTKAQRRVIREMREQGSPHLLNRPAYGEFLDWDQVFPRDDSDSPDTTNTSNDSTQGVSRDIWVEVGFGTGDNLLCLAERGYPTRKLVGADVHNGGLGKALQRIQGSIERGRPWRGYKLFGADDGDDDEVDEWNRGDEKDSDTSAESNFVSSSSYSNVRLNYGDGIKLLNCVPSSTVSVVMITFPDPFPKNQQAELRVVQIHTVQIIHRALKKPKTSSMSRQTGEKQENDERINNHKDLKWKSGRLCVATDHPVFYDWTMAVMDQPQCAKLFRKIDFPRQEWLPVISKYEQRGLENGRQTHLACWEAI